MFLVGDLATLVRSGPGSVRVFPRVVGLVINCEVKMAAFTHKVSKKAVFSMRLLLYEWMPFENG